MKEHTLDHVGVVVGSLDEAIPTWERLVGARAADREKLDAQGIEVTFVGSGPGRIELIAPTRADSSVSRFLERRGPGLHHICYRVPDIRAALKALADAGYELVDRVPRMGAGGHLAAFLHPRAAGGVLVELVEATDPHLAPPST